MSARHMVSESESVSHSAVLTLTPWTAACQTPLSMDSPGKDTGGGSHSLLQGIFQTQVSCTSGRFFTAEPPGKTWHMVGVQQIFMK